MLLPSRRDFDLFEDMFKDPFLKVESKIMKTDIKETDKDYIIDIDLPGYDKENINIEVENGYLTISATSNSSNEEKNENYVRKERYSGECKRSFYIGEEVSEDEIKAVYKNGILSLNVPKVEKQIPSKKTIKIED